MSNHRKLKSFLLLPRFQLLFVFVNWLILMTTCLFAFFTVNQSFLKMKEIGLNMNLDNNSGYMKFLSMQEQFINGSLLIFLGGALLVSLVITIYFSHKVAGPIYRIKEYFKNFDPNNKKPIVFRKGDFFDELPEIINTNLDIVKKD